MEFSWRWLRYCDVTWM